MSTPSAIEVCRSDLFTKKDELEQRYPQVIVDKVLRVREMYNWFIANPDGTDREFVNEVCQRHEISKVTAYSDLAIVKTLLPTLGQASRDFHRWRTNEMLMNTFKMAQKRKDTKTMERAATAYGKLNRVDLEDEQAMPYDMIVPQQFTATDDPRVLGIEPIPNIQEKISSMIEKYRKETIDIEDVEFEEVDLEFDVLFPDKTNDDATEEGLL
ncbi:MAG: hypothetical protein J1E63_03505 [Muribaculaceae bacterium]|nr:hypothetical protein [Muribaculaceae bacterium]